MAFYKLGLVAITGFIGTKLLKKTDFFKRSEYNHYREIPVKDIKEKYRDDIVKTCDGLICEYTSPSYKDKTGASIIAPLWRRGWGIFSWNHEAPISFIHNGGLALYYHNRGEIEWD